jgi:DNA-binding response OmpR family regulator
VDFFEEAGKTVFYVDLPCWDHLVGMAIDRDAPADARRILLCEDDPDTAIVLREQLRRFGFATDFAYTAADAITLAAATPYCVVLTDLQLPDGDGIELIVQLRALTEYADTPIIVVSANATLGRTDARSSELKVFHWLCKPVDFDYLMRVLPEQQKISV